MNTKINHIFEDSGSNNTEENFYLPFNTIDVLNPYE